MRLNKQQEDEHRLKSITVANRWLYLRTHYLRKKHYLLGITFVFQRIRQNPILYLEVREGKFIEQNCNGQKVHENAFVNEQKTWQTETTN